ncbi:MAG: acetylornithine deacetylase [Rickettsiales bacterium]|nr:acetylornithine deacetylase [Rickettsiales bacterium]|tara:strand:+ start:1451 stop:2677 length:1227 start_codon:yes stop_codon:yes gene_type:complete
MMQNLKEITQELSSFNIDIDTLYQEAEAILAKLISCNTISSNSNMNIMEYIQNYLKEYDIPSTLIHDGMEEKANIVIRVGPDVPGGLILSGHSDVVPVEGQDWHTDPFELTDKDDGKLYGRGTCDMKGFLATTLAMVPYWAQMDLKKPFYLLFSYDEETGCYGIQKAIPELLNHTNQPRAVLIGEPTDMRAVVTHKGIKEYVMTFKGIEAHSSLTHRAVNAVSYAARAVNFLDELQKEIIAEKDGQDEQFDPPYTTINVGIVKGGTAVNIVPNICELHWHFRFIPGFDPDRIMKPFNEFLSKLEAEMKAKNDKCSIEAEELVVMPAFKLSEGPEAEEFIGQMLQLSESNQTLAVAYGTEAGFIQALDLPIVICGPGSIEQAHKPNEFVSKDQLKKSLIFLARLSNHMI